MEFIVYNYDSHNSNNYKEFLKNKDQQFMQMQELIDAKRHMLIEKQKNLIKFTTK